MMKLCDFLASYTTCLYEKPENPKFAALRATIVYSCHLIDFSKILWFWNLFIKTSVFTLGLMKLQDFVGSYTTCLYEKPENPKFAALRATIV